MVERQSERIALRITQTEALMLLALVERSGLNVTDYARTLIRAEYARVFGERPVPKRPKPKRK